MDEWKAKRKAVGLDTAISQRDKAAASNVILAIENKDLTLEQLFRGMDNLMADEEWRGKYSFQGFINDVSRWLNPQEVGKDGNKRTGTAPSRSNAAKARPPDYSTTQAGEIV